MRIIAAAVFEVQSMYHKIKDNIPGQIYFGRDMILLIKHVADWRYICQSKQTQIKKTTFMKITLE